MQTKPVLMVGLALTLVTLHGRADGDEGVRLLRQPRAFPITIDVSGSYRLRSNIVIPDANTTAIVISAEDVTLDLNGFAILGPTDCGGGIATTCSPTGNGDGISASGQRNIAVANGTVRGMGRDGIAFNYAGRVERVRAYSNGRDGIRIGGTASGCRVVDSDATANGRNGIMVDDRCVVRGNVATYNGDNGLYVGDQAVVSGNIASVNHGRGIYIGVLSGGDLFLDNMVSENGDTGIDSEGGLALVSTNVVTLNSNYDIRAAVGLLSGNLVRGGNGAGVRLDERGLVTGNLIDGGVGLGLDFGGTAGYSNNAVMESNGGSANPQVSGGTEIGTNLCGVDTSCP